jgi:hypothetical protein
MKFPSRSVKINLCGTIPFPCGNKSFRADNFRFVRAKFNPCGQLAVPCEPAFTPCGHKSIRAAKIRFVRAKTLVFFDFKRKMMVLDPPHPGLLPQGEGETLPDFLKYGRLNWQDNPPPAKRRTKRLPLLGERAGVREVKIILRQLLTGG